VDRVLVGDVADDAERARLFGRDLLVPLRRAGDKGAPRMRRWRTSARPSPDVPPVTRMRSPRSAPSAIDRSSMALTSELPMCR
jgi:hypothetical protein